MRIIWQMRIGISALLLAFGAWAGTAGDLAETVRTGLRTHRLDSEIATAVSQANLTERPDDTLIEKLEWEGAGPLTIGALERLRDSDVPPAPSGEERDHALEAARQTSLRYTAELPNFICTETVRRYTTGKVFPPWNLRDTLTVEVAYADKGERYKLVAINEKPTTKKISQSGGFNSNGEFGSLLREIFEPESAAVFTWERWTNLRGRLMHVFSYRIDLAHSKYSVNLNSFFKRYKGKFAMKGLVFVDRESNQVIRFSAEADGLPANWPVLRTLGTVDYGLADVGGQKYLLPQRVDTRIVLSSQQLRNVKEFGNYRKFSSEASLTFEKTFEKQF